MKFTHDHDAGTERIEGLLGRWLTELDGAEACEITVLPGGANNQNFLVVYGGSRYVLRLAPPFSVQRGAGSDMRASNRTAELAGAAGIGPHVYGVDPRSGSSLIGYYPEGSLTPEAVRSCDVLAQIADGQRRFHRLPTAGLRRISSFEDIDFLIGRAQAAGALPEDLYETLKPQLAACREVIEGVGGAVVSHRDVNPQNLILTAEGVVFIDFDYAGVDTPYLDPTMLIEYAELEEEQIECFLGAAIPDLLPQDRARIGLMGFVHCIREWSWALTAGEALEDLTSPLVELLPSSGAVADDFYSGYAAVTSARAEEKLRDPRFDRWLELGSDPVGAPGDR